jgi:hypothetical protein
LMDYSQDETLKLLLLKPAHNEQSN